MSAPFAGALVNVRVVPLVVNASGVYCPTPSTNTKRFAATPGSSDKVNPVVDPSPAKSSLVNVPVVKMSLNKTRIFAVFGGAVVNVSVVPDTV